MHLVVTPHVGTLRQNVIAQPVHNLLHMLTHLQFSFTAVLVHSAIHPFPSLSPSIIQNPDGNILSPVLVHSTIHFRLSLSLSKLLPGFHLPLIQDALVSQISDSSPYSHLTTAPSYLYRNGTIYNASSDFLPEVHHNAKRKDTGRKKRVYVPGTANQNILRATGSHLDSVFRANSSHPAYPTLAKLEAQSIQFNLQECFQGVINGGNELALVLNLTSRNVFSPVS